MKPNEQDAGPYRIDLLRILWPRIARMVEALRQVGAVTSTEHELRQLVDVAADHGDGAIDNAEITRVLRVLSWQDGMHAGDWLRMKAVEADMPRRKPPPAVDLQIRLRGLNCKRLVARLDDEKQQYRVTIHSSRGDVVSAESNNFPNALEGAIKMAGARAEDA